jgi:hypothetical protein
MGISFVYVIQRLEERLIVEVNIDQDIALREFQCCGAANPKTHSVGKE